MVYFIVVCFIAEKRAENKDKIFMKETICTIPVNEIFEQTGGCPVCRMKSEIEQKYVDYISGAAMMEPSVRKITNKQGFCRRHFDHMINLEGRRLSVSLMIESHLAELEKVLGNASKAARMEESCFVCDYIENHLSRAVDTVFITYRNEPEFRELFSQQEYLCLPHYGMLITEGKGRVGKFWGEFCKTSHHLALNKIKSLRQQLSGFSESFDYRNSGAPMTDESRRSIENSIAFLTGN